MLRKLHCRHWILPLAAAMMLSLFGCQNSQAGSSGQGVGSEVSSPSSSAASSVSLSGKSLHIYCGAGMTDPFKEIADAFKAKTGCEMDVTYGNAGQIQSQINTSKEGDLFIAGSADELMPVKSYVTKSRDLVRHIPVLVVKEGNPKGIHGLSDLTKDGVSLLIGDTESTPIGKIAKKALSDLKIYTQVDIPATTTTAPQLATAISQGQADAAIVWKENCNSGGVEIVDTTDLEKYTKTIPAATLSCTADQTAVDAFMAFLDESGAKDIWTKYGYELIN